MALLFLPVMGQAAVIGQYGGSYANWPSVWTSLELNDADNGLNEYTDIVGDTTDPAAYWAQGSGYVYFRIRLDTGTFDAAQSAAKNTWLVMVDAVNYVSPTGGTNRPDYAFMFDLKGEVGGGAGNHGLEMGVLDTSGPTWGDTKFDDVDGDAAKKIAPPDFATSGGDGYVRTTDEVGTTSFGATTFMDFAIKSLYLGSNVPNLTSDGLWRVQFATIQNATDHNKIDADVAGNQSPGSTIAVDGWSQIIGPIGQIPEPSWGIPVAFLAMLGLGVWVRARRGAPVLNATGVCPCTPQPAILSSMASRGFPVRAHAPLTDHPRRRRRRRAARSSASAARPATAEGSGMAIVALQ